jgi:hypothetical protein
MRKDHLIFSYLLHQNQHHSYQEAKKLYEEKQVKKVKGKKMTFRITKLEHEYTRDLIYCEGKLMTCFTS